MHLAGADGTELRLSVAGYQFPEMPGSGTRDWDENWLFIAGEVRSGDLAWTFRDPCMATWEARELLAWMRQVADGTVRPGDGPGSGDLWWVEPNLRFSLERQTETGATVLVFLSQESSPPGADQEVRFGEGHRVALELTLEAIARAADQWAVELAAFPQR